MSLGALATARDVQVRRDHLGRPRRPSARRRRSRSRRGPPSLDGTELGQPGVQRLGVAAEVVVGLVADAQHRVPHPVQGGRVRRRQPLPELGTVVRRPAVTEGAGDDHHLAGTRRDPRAWRRSW